MQKKISASALSALVTFADSTVAAPAAIRPHGCSAGARAEREPGRHVVHTRLPLRRLLRLLRLPHLAPVPDADHHERRRWRSSPQLRRGSVRCSTWEGCYRWRGPSRRPRRERHQPAEEEGSALLHSSFRRQEDDERRQRDRVKRDRDPDKQEIERQGVTPVGAGGPRGDEQQVVPAAPASDRAAATRGSRCESRRDAGSSQQEHRRSMRFRGRPTPLLAPPAPGTADSGP